MIDLNTCNYIVYGHAHANYSTHTHIHEGFYRTLNFMFGEPEKFYSEQVKWFESISITGANYTNTLFITNHDYIKDIPLSFILDKTNFFVVHGLNDHAEALERFKGLKNYLSWNVFHDFSSTLGQPKKDYPRPANGVSLTEKIWLAEDTPLYPLQRQMDFRWATDLLPHEIEANKPKELLSLKNKVINWVGTRWWVNDNELNEFILACNKDGVKFNHLGAGQVETRGKKVITIEENIRLVRESWMAPAISGSHHITEGYAPCRIFKNISYGQMGITNSKRVNDIFAGKLIYNPNPYKLYWEAKERLQTMPIEELHILMDEVSQKHTYINRINSILEAIKYLS